MTSPKWLQWRSCWSVLVLVSLALLALVSQVVTLPSLLQVPGASPTSTRTRTRTRTGTSTLQKERPFVSFLLQNFPECVPPLVPDDPGDGISHQHAKRQPIHLPTMGFYQRFPNHTHTTHSQDYLTTPRYDAVSCYVMKARYNCAYRPDAPFTMAHQFQLLLQLHNNTSNSNNNSNNTHKPCSLREVVDSVLQRMQHPITHQPSETSSKTLQTHSHHVLMQGNSYLRQVWEALVCTLPQDRITHLAVQTGGPGVSIKDFQARHDRLISPNDLGTLVTNRTWLQQQGCHGESSEDLSRYFRKRAIRPTNIPRCNDNVAMVEVQLTDMVEDAVEDDTILVDEVTTPWRFSFVFKPTMYSPTALQELYGTRLGLPILDDVHGTANHSGPSTTTTTTSVSLLWNHVTKEPQNETPASLSIQRSIPVESWMWTLRDLQLRDLGEYFGANNPWVRDPPDFHACMPGPPDDQVNLMLYLLWSGFTILP